MKLANGKRMKPTEALLQAIAVTAELTGTQMSRIAGRVMADDLARYPEAQVLAALTRCRRELKGRLTIADVVTRLDDGRPGAEEAWAMIPKDESGSAVWTEEMAYAYGVCSDLMADDQIAARMAFKETYAQAVAKARDSGGRVKWTPTLGHDAGGREGVLIEAARFGRISADHAAKLLLYRDPPSEQIKELLSSTKMLQKPAVLAPLAREAS